MAKEILISKKERYDLLVKLLENRSENKNTIEYLISTFSQYDEYRTLVEKTIRDINESDKNKSKKELDNLNKNILEHYDFILNKIPLLLFWISLLLFLLCCFVFKITFLV